MIPSGRPDRPRRLADAGCRAACRIAYRLMTAWWFLRRPCNQGAVVAVWHGSRVLLARCSYRRCIILPGGFVRRGEDFARAAARELAEEVGIAVDPGALTAAGAFYHETEHLRDVVHVFELALEGRPAVAIDRREIVWADFVAVERALAMALLPPVRHYLEARRLRMAAPLLN